MAAPRKLTDEQEDKALALYRAGASLLQLEIMYGVGRRAIKAALLRAQHREVR